MRVGSCPSVLLCIPLALAMAAGCGRKDEAVSDKLPVVASIAPLADFARQVGGDLVRVDMIIPPGASPHTYQFRPDQMKALSAAAVLVLNGIGLEYWADKAIDAAANPKLVVVRTADGIPVLDSGGDEHPGGNPHVWLDPVLAVRQVEAIRDAFIKADPPNSGTYRTNAARYIAELKRLDAQIRRSVKGFRQKRFIAFHPAWSYFVRRYGLVQAAVIEDFPGKEPDPARIRQVVQIARRLKARAVFAEPQFSPRAAQVIAEEAGAKVVMLDPLGRPPDYSYLTTMRGNLSQMESALK